MGTIIKSVAWKGTKKVQNYHEKTYQNLKAQEKFRNTQVQPLQRVEIGPINFVVELEIVKCKTNVRHKQTLH